MNMAQPGPNVGGPCLFKDGKFLLSSVPFVDLIQTSFIINEGMPDFIFETFIKGNIQPYETVAIHGVSFKANSDDIRNSLSFKMEKVLRKHGINKIYMIDPNVKGFLKESPKKEYIPFHIIMTPHDQFKQLGEERLINLKKIAYPKNETIIDPWKLTSFAKKTPSGVYELNHLGGMFSANFSNR